MDLSVNKSGIGHLKTSFQMWYVFQIQQAPGPDSPLTSCLSTSHWLIKAYDYINGFKKDSWHFGKNND